MSFRMDLNRIWRVRKTFVFSHPHVFYIHSFKILVKMTILYVYILIGDGVLWMQKLSQ